MEVTATNAYGGRNYVFFVPANLGMPLKKSCSSFGLHVRICSLMSFRNLKKTSGSQSLNLKPATD